MRERKQTRPRRSIAPSRTVPRPQGHDSSPLSSVRSDVDVNKRNGPERIDAHYISSVARMSAARDNRSAGVGIANYEIGRHTQERGRILEDRSPDDFVRDGLTTESHRESRSRRPTLHYSQRPRSASPIQTEETCYRSRSPLLAAPKPIPRTSREIEHEKARIDQEAAEFEAQYQ
ncbi:hypothetical protein DPSP01_004922 [Paraphaeosphaeria sporulosa]